MPSIDALFRELEKDGLSVLLIDIREDRETVRRVVQSRGYAAPVLMDADASLSDTYGVRGTPTVFLIGRDGTLRGRAIGPRPLDRARRSSAPPGASRRAGPRALTR